MMAAALAPAAVPTDAERRVPVRRVRCRSAVAIAREIGRTERRLDALPDDAHDLGQIPLLRRRAELLAELARTPARDLDGLGAKLAQAVALLADEFDDEGLALVASALGDVDRLRLVVAND